MLSAQTRSLHAWSLLAFSPLSLSPLTTLTWHASAPLLPLIIHCSSSSAQGPAQLTVGAMITFGFLIMNLSYRPYCTDGLNSLQTFSLISQFLTLFCGILIGYAPASGVHARLSREI